jgi:hypothetical protein
LLPSTRRNMFTPKESLSNSATRLRPSRISKAADGPLLRRREMARRERSPSGERVEVLHAIIRQFSAVADSALEGDGFEPLVPRRRNPPRACHVISRRDSTSSWRH